MYKLLSDVPCQAVREVGWDLQQWGDIIGLARKRSRCIMGSQASEDCFNAAKNSKLVKGKKRFRRPEKSFAVMISRGVAHRVHRYEKLQPDVAVPRSSALSVETFKANATTSSIDLSRVASTERSPPWPTCAPEDLGRAHADMQLARDILRTGDASKVGRAWLGQLCAHSHHLMLHKTGAPMSEWFQVLRNWGDSSVLVWPMIRHAFPGNRRFWFEPVRDIIEPQLISFWDLDEWSAASFEWKSPLWQKINEPRTFAQLPFAIRRVSSGPPKRVLEVAAEKGFWRLGSTFLLQLARDLGVQVPGGPSLLQLLSSLVQSILNLDEWAAMEHLRHRLADFRSNNRHGHELLEVEELDGALETHDVKVMTQTKDEVKRDLQEAKDSSGSRQSRVKTRLAIWRVVGPGKRLRRCVELNFLGSVHWRRHSMAVFDPFVIVWGLGDLYVQMPSEHRVV